MYTIICTRISSLLIISILLVACVSIKDNHSNIPLNHITYPPVSERSSANPDSLGKETTTITTTELDYAPIQSICTPLPDKRLIIPDLDPLGDNQDVLLSYLNQGGSPDVLLDALLITSALIEKTSYMLKAKIAVSDLTGDRVPELIIELLFFPDTDLPVNGNIYLFDCENGKYESAGMIPIISARLNSPNPDPATGLRDIQDMDQDGNAELVIAFVDAFTGKNTYTNNQDIIRRFEIFDWNGATFVDLLSEYEVGSQLSTFNGDGTIRDTNGDGYPDLVLKNGVPHESGQHAPILYRPHTEIWGWDGQSFKQFCWFAVVVPTYRFQAIEDGDNAILCGDFTKALRSYQLALTDNNLLDWKQIILYDPPTIIKTADNPDPEERPRLEAYGHYRLMLLYAKLGLYQEAQDEYATIVAKIANNSSGYAYAELANSFWSKYQSSRDIMAACEEASSYAYDNYEAIIDPLSSKYYFYSSRIYDDAEDMCPFR